GVDRVDGDERQLAPILAGVEGGRASGFGLGQGLAPEHVRNAVRMDRDHAHGAFGFQRAQPLLDTAGGEPDAALPRHLGGDEIAVLRVGGRPGRDCELALLLVDGRKPPAAARQPAEDTEHALLGTIDDLDDPPAVADLLIVVADLLDAQQRTIVHAGDFARPAAPRRAHPDLRRRPVRVLVPFGRHRDEFAVGLAARNVGEHDGRQVAGMMQLGAAALEPALVRQLPQHALERDAVTALDPEGACDLALARLAGVLADEGEEIFLGREGRWFALLLRQGGILNWRGSALTLN